MTEVVLLEPIRPIGVEIKEAHGNAEDYVDNCEDRQIFWVFLTHKSDVESEHRDQQDIFE